MGRPARPELREALLEAARTEFARRGLERARVEDIARRAGASKGAFYLHFAGKEQAFEEILQRFMGALEDQAQRREDAEIAFRTAHARRAPEDLRPLQMEFDCRVDLEILEMLWRNRQLLAVIDGAGGDKYHRMVNEFRRRMHGLVAGRMAEKQAAGWIRRDLDPSLLGDILVGTFEGFARRALDQKDRPDLDAWLRSFTSVLYDGAFAPREPAQAGRPRPAPRPRGRAPARRRRAAGSD
ncbi:MAG TPA: helix-turn-helix domain-containing protein [Anaeromyxobacter sp.]|nr:helix-turn-helix domain-containing protein [Anaeromyxobacter sp.]